jgi:hypothetical protein
VNHDIPPPPVDLFYDTLEEALEVIREFTKQHGYALTKLRCKEGKDGEVNKVYLQEGTQDTNTHRIASRSEVTLQEGRSWKCGRGRNHGSTQETTRQMVNLFIFYLFSSRDSAIHPEGICGLGKTKEMNPVDGPRPVCHNKVNPPPSAVRCAQVSGYELPLQKSVKRERRKQARAHRSQNRHPSGWNTGITLRPSGLLPPPSPTPPVRRSTKRQSPNKRGR